MECQFRATESEGRLQVSRRDFLGTVVGVSGALLLVDPTKAAEVGAELPTIRIRVQRDVDLLNLQFSFVNFALRQEDLVALGSGRSLIIVRFPSQNLAEAVFDRPTSSGTFEFDPIELSAEAANKHSPIPPVTSYLSGPSWLVFMVPDGVRLPFRRQGQPVSVVDSWLRLMSDWKIRVPRNAVKPGTPTMPRFDETCLEIPFRLFISPTSEDTRWLTSSERLWGLDPPRGSTRKLWHAALHSRRHIKPAQLAKGITNIPPELAPPTRITVQARAVFSPDYRLHDAPPANEYYPGTRQLSLHEQTRHSLVKQMALGDGWIDAEHLILSALGCDASLSYFSQRTFDDILKKQLASNEETVDDAPNLSIFKHRIQVGRDCYFAEVYMGFLFPFVFPALAVEVTRRSFAAHKLNRGARTYGPPGAYLLKERFILIQDPLKQFPDSGSTIGRNMPLKRVQVTQTRSPLLANWDDYFEVLEDCDQSSQAYGAMKQDEIEIVRNGRYFIPRTLDEATNPGADGYRWPIEFEDEAGQKSRTSDACLLFAEHVVHGQKLWRALRPQFRRWSLPAEKIAFAPDRAELTVLATNDTTNTSLDLVSPGQQLYRYTLGNDERQAARVLADVLREAKRTWADFQKLIDSTSSDVAQFISRVGTMAREARLAAGALEAEAKEFQNVVEAQLRGLREQTLNELQKCVDTIKDQQKKIKDFQDDAYEELLRQLQRAEQVTSSLETHVLSFDATIVRDLYDKAENKLQDIANHARTAQQFIEKISTDLDIAHEGDAWKERLKREAENRIRGLGADAALNEVRAYARELKQAATMAKDQANNLLHAQMAEAEVVVPALKAIAANSPAKAISLLDDYLSKGMGDLGSGLSRVQNGAFAKLQQAIDQGSAMGDKVRSAVARPAAVIAGLSRDLGALSGGSPAAIDKLVNQISGDKSLQPTIEDLKDAIPDAKLFGCLPLREIIKAMGALGGIGRGQLPNINLVTLPDHYEQVWEWTTDVDSRNFGILKFDIEPPVNKYRVALHISSINRVDTPKVDPKAVASGKPIDTKLRGKTILRGFLGYWDEQAKKALGDDQQIAFHLIILGMIDVPFRSVEFSAEGALGETPSPKVTPHMGQIGFLGPLKFVKNLQEIISSLLGDRFTLEVTPEDITVGFSLPVPAISFGAVSIRNISVGTALVLSFTNKPLAFRFNFASFRNPFEVAVMCFGGRGFFQAQLATDGSRDLQGAIEFGGVLAFDVTVASGDLYIMAGFYFRITNAQTDLSGYIRAGGNLHVLGLIHASVEFMLAGRYRKEGKNNLIYGICTITVSIDLFLYSIDVDITMEKRIAGSSDSDSDNSQAAVRRQGGLFHFASLSAPAEAPYRAPLAYFARDWRDVPGRFDYDQLSPAESTRLWDKLYWSQFAFDEIPAGA